MKNVENMNLVLEKLGREITSNYNAAKTLINTYDFLLDAIKQGGINCPQNDTDNFGNWLRVGYKNLTEQQTRLIEIINVLDNKITHNLECNLYKDAHTLGYIKGKTISVLNELSKYLEHNKY